MDVLNFCPRDCNMPKRRIVAFTLIELLRVIGISDGSQNGRSFGLNRMKQADTGHNISIKQ